MSYSTYVGNKWATMVARTGLNGNDVPCGWFTVNATNVLSLTNIGTFRAYCTAYLRSRKTVAQNMTLMTRQLDPTPEGLPLEIYAFANTTVWEDFEGIQADILDHLIAALPEFGLELYQYGVGFRA